MTTVVPKIDTPLEEAANMDELYTTVETVAASDGAVQPLDTSANPPRQGVSDIPVIVIICVVTVLLHGVFHVAKYWSNWWYSMLAYRSVSELDDAEAVREVQCQ